MLPDNKLDFITNIDPEYVDMMNNLRKEFIGLDVRIRLLGSLDDSKKEGAARCLSIARTNLESACMYAIKSLCIMGENKPV